MRRWIPGALALLLIASIAIIGHPVLRADPPPAQASGMPPVGAIIAWHRWGGETKEPPAGWVVCDGREITDPAFVAVFGEGKRAPDLNRRPCFLRGDIRSPVDGFAGDDRRLHHHGIPHDHPHLHAIDHTHAMPHRHPVRLSTQREGGDAPGSRSGLGGTRSHQHRVDGSTGTTDRAETGKANPALSGPARGVRGDLRSAAAVAGLPRHFAVTWIIRVR